MTELGPLLHVPRGTCTRLLHARRDYRKLSRQLDELYAELHRPTMPPEGCQTVEASVERVERQMATLSGTIDGLKEALKPTFWSAP
jgi:hypothetical protein